MQRRYAGQFAQLDGQELRCILDGHAKGEAFWCTAHAVDILSARSWLEVDLIARRIEGVIWWSVAGEIEDFRRGREAQAFEIGVMRRALGDVGMWLDAGAEAAPEPPDAGPLPPDVTRAEYLAVMALWKAWQLDLATTRILKSVDEARAGGDWRRPVDTVTAAVLHPLSGMFEIANLSAELARAAALAEQAEYLDERIASTSEEAAKAAQEILRQQLRERGAKGGRNKAEAYRPSKDRILQLYRDGGYTGSRAAAADAIFEQLRVDGEEVPHSRVLRTLAAEDSRAKARTPAQQP